MSGIRATAIVWLPQGGNLTPVALPIVHLQVTAGINEIPMAQFQVAVGREAITGLPSNIHYLADYLTMQLSVQIYVLAAEFGNAYGYPLEPWPAGPFLIFEGRLSGCGFTKTKSGKAAYNITAHHWLMDLNSSSSLTRSTNTVTPSQLSNAATFFSGTGFSGSFSSQTLADEFINAAVIETDFWGYGLKPWLLQLCERDILTDSDDPVLSTAYGINFEAINALQRFEPFLSPSGPFYRFGVPIRMDANDVIETSEATQAIADDIAQETFDSFASTTLWDKLVNQFAASYQFAIIPLIQSALVVPLCPGIRNVWQIIYAEEYDSISLSGEIPRPVRGVRLQTGAGSQTGAFGSQLGETQSQNDGGGRYDNPFMQDGMIDYRSGPRWLSNLASPSSYGPTAIAPDTYVGSALTPGIGAAAAIPPGLLRARGRALYDAYAHAIYVNQVTRGRSGTISGRLRFDIAPGSSVGVVLSEEKFIKFYTGQRNSIMVGTVRRVTHVLDSESMQAGTLFDIGWLRSQVENAYEGMSTDGHPFWSNQWLGAPYVELPHFIPRGNLWGFGM